MVETVPLKDVDTSAEDQTDFLLLTMQMCSSVSVIIQQLDVGQEQS